MSKSPLTPKLFTSEPKFRVAYDHVYCYQDPFLNYSDNDSYPNPFEGYQMVNSTLGEIYHFLDEHKGQSKVFFYFEDTWASGHHGETIIYFTAYLSNQEVLELKYIEEDRDYCVRTEEVNKPCSTVKELKDLLRKEIDIQLDGPHGETHKYSEALRPQLVMKIDSFDYDPTDYFRLISS